MASDAKSPQPGVWSLEHPIATTVGLAVLIVIIVTPVCVHLYSDSIR
jgi:hypothetical protein